ncbi:unnamed protein product [Camellia sinensis]
MTFLVEKISVNEINPNRNLCSINKLNAGDLPRLHEVVGLRHRLQRRRRHRNRPGGEAPEWSLVEVVKTFVEIERVTERIVPEVHRGRGVPPVVVVAADPADQVLALVLNLRRPDPHRRGSYQP